MSCQTANDRVIVLYPMILPILFALWISMLFLVGEGTDTKPGEPVVEPAVQPAPEDKPEVSAAMKLDFLDRYRAAVLANDPIKYLALVCLDGMDANSRAVVAQGAQRSLSFVVGHAETLSFDWVDPDPDDTKIFEKNGFRYHPNLKPSISLTINIKRDPSESKELPTALQPTLGIKDGQLYILGMVHEALPAPPPAQKTDD